MSAFFSSAKVLICMGSGGVGKTTVSTAVAYLAAAKGRKVLLLTIDPSQRLKTILGLSEDGAVKTIHGKAGVQFDAGVVNHEKVFSEFVSRALDASPERTEKLLKNKLYQQLVSHLSGSQEFTALQRLYQGTQNDKYDLVILDTPPAQHAIEFLQAPQKLSALFREGIAKWFRKQENPGFLSKVVHFGTVKALGAIEGLTGRQFFQELRDFFENVYEWSGRLEARLVEIQRMLASAETVFLLVSSHDLVKLTEAEAVARELRKSGHNLRAVILNRTQPLWVGQPIHKGWQELRTKMESYYEERQAQFQQWSEQHQMPDGSKVLQIPEMSKDVESLEDIYSFIEYLNPLMEISAND